ncbi:MAG: aldehyde dehydrogenase [Gammaproteobacteria bacterium]
MAAIVQSDFNRNRPLVAGEWLAKTSVGEVPHVYPGDGKPQATVHVGGAPEIERAAVSAVEGQRAWAAMGAAARRDALLRLADKVRENGEQFTRLAARESGVPVFMGGGMDLAQHWMRYYAGWADKVDGVMSEPLNVSGLGYVRPEPIGVVGVIIPWNMPLIAMSMTVIPPLAAGNAVVLKPPTLTPFGALRLGELALEAGLPPGTLNVVPGDAEAGNALVAHPAVGKISFTGGLAVARQVMSVAAQHLKPTTMELGGKSAVLVCEDADLDIAAQVCSVGILALAGQGCVNPTRPLVHAKVYDAFLERMVANIKAWKLGDPQDPSTMIGPVISRASCERIVGIIERARSESSGTVVVGGKRAGGALAEGFYIEPTVFANLDYASSLAREEVFGPVTGVIRFESEEQAIAIGNDTQFGLGAYVITRDLARAHRLASRLVAGSVYINTPTPMSPNLPFGGVKASGFGRLGGRYGLEEFLHMKTVYAVYS